MYNDYRTSLFWFHISVMLGESGILAILPIAVTFTTKVLKMDSSEVGFVFIVALFSTVPGTPLQQLICQRTDPKISWVLNFFFTAIVSVVGTFALTEDRKFLAYVWGALWGFSFTWYISTKTVIFSAILPKGQDSEFSGFFVYASQILVWLPPLLYSVMVEAGMNQQWGLMPLAIFSFVAGLLSLFMAPWTEIMKTVSVAGRPL